MKHLKGNNKRLGTVISLLSALILASCATADKREYIDGWMVMTNDCGEQTSRIRNKQSDIRYLREADFFSDEKRTIFGVRIQATRGGTDLTVQRYTNDAENKQVSSIEINDNRLGNELIEAVDSFYDQPGKHEEIDMGCLLRGIRNA